MLREFSFVAFLERELGSPLTRVDYELLRQARGVRLISPGFDPARSFAVHIHGNRLLARQVSALDRSGDNLLLFRAPCEFSEFVVVGTDQETVLRYQRMTPGECGLPDSFGTAKGLLYGRLFRQVHRGEWEKLKRFDAEEKVLDGRPAAWLNPLIVTLPVAGDEWQEETSGVASVAHVLAACRSASKDWFLEPHFAPELNGRCIALTSLHRQAIERGNSRSVMEQLLLGADRGATSDADPWRWMLALDLYSGMFVLPGSGTDAQWLWRPPAKLGANAQALAKYAASRVGLPDPIFDSAVPDIRGGGTSAALEVPGNGILSAPRREVHRRPPWRFRIRSTSDACPYLRASGALAPFVSPEDVSDAPSEHLLAWLAQVIRPPSQPGDGRRGDVDTECEARHYRCFDDMHWGHVCIRGESGRWDLAIDEIGLFEEFARRYLAPRSGAYLRMPELDADARRSFDDTATPDEPDNTKSWFELLASLDDGGRRLLAGLVFQERHCREDTSADPARPAVSDSVEIDYRMGWWWDWYATLFTAPITAPVRFRLQQRFRLARSRLGYARLGRSDTACLGRLAPQI